MLLLLLLFLINPPIYIRLEANLAGVGSTNDKLTQPTTFTKESLLPQGIIIIPSHKGLCELTVACTAKREWDRKRSSYISPDT